MYYTYYVSTSRINRNGFKYNPYLSFYDPMILTVFAKCLDSVDLPMSIAVVCSDWTAI